MSLFRFIIPEIAAVVAEISFATLSFSSAHIVSVSACNIRRVTVTYRKSMAPAELADRRTGEYHFFPFTAFIVVQGAK